MAYLSGSPSQHKIIHSKYCLLAVPAGLCVAAVAIRWMMALVY